jgi:hypothetical protein
VSAHVSLRDFDEAGGADRARALEHVAACRACRAAIAASDPSRVFALLALRPIPAAILERATREVLEGAGRHRGGFSGRWTAARGAKRAAAAAVVALALLTGAATWIDRPQAPPPYAATRANVEVLPATGVSQVVDLTVGDVQVVMVYNGDLQL